MQSIRWRRHFHCVVVELISIILMRYLYENRHSNDMRALIYFSILSHWCGIAGREKKRTKWDSASGRVKLACVMLSGWNWYICNIGGKKGNANGVNDGLFFQYATVYDPFWSVLMAPWFIDLFLWHQHAHQDFFLYQQERNQMRSVSLKFYRLNEMEIATENPNMIYICIL